MNALNAPVFLELLVPVPFQYQAPDDEKEADDCGAAHNWREECLYFEGECLAQLQRGVLGGGAGGGLREECWVDRVKERGRRRVGSACKVKEIDEK